ncbi:hypothetical protein P280DRAFT_163202 [Massarina eburnea CBS 473.64]|uniref:Uncharacterized protein n=1 Tax=Massarina eburnea CBS 473.64 TaxID=1395130 RepID=A0A6A6RLJ9_9PLEO|nr:hypothetical protein P280DRAFT_163202 [Massarina eburnea CBS 473.64]
MKAHPELSALEGGKGAAAYSENHDIQPSAMKIRLESLGNVKQTAFPGVERGGGKRLREASPIRPGEMEHENHPNAMTTPLPSLEGKKRAPGIGQSLDSKCRKPNPTKVEKHIEDEYMANTEDAGTPEINTSKDSRPPMKRSKNSHLIRQRRIKHVFTTFPVFPEDEDDCPIPGMPSPSPMPAGHGNHTPIRWDVIEQIVREKKKRRRLTPLEAVDEWHRRLAVTEYEVAYQRAELARKEKKEQELVEVSGGGAQTSSSLIPTPTSCPHGIPDSAANANNPAHNNNNPPYLAAELRKIALRRAEAYTYEHDEIAAFKRDCRDAIEHAPNKGTAQPGVQLIIRMAWLRIGEVRRWREREMELLGEYERGVWREFGGGEVRWR